MLFSIPYLNFIFTFIIEYIIVLAFLRKQPLKTAGFVLLVNLFSWPIANFFYGFYNNLLIIEIGVVIVESFLLMYLFELNYRKSILIAFVSNLASFLAGYLLW